MNIDQGIIENKDFQEIEQSIKPVLKQAENIVISSDEELIKAGSKLKEVKDFQRRITSVKQDITRPLNEGLRNARDLFRPVETKIVEAEASIKAAMLMYEKEKAQKAQIEKDKISKRVDKGTMKFETAAKKMETIPQTPTTLKTRKGEVQFREVKAVEIFDVAKLSREYLIPDTVKIRKDALSGIKIEGVRVVTKKQVSA